jgi:hypothetical protein
MKQTFKKYWINGYHENMYGVKMFCVGLFGYGLRISNGDKIITLFRIH